MNTKHLMTISSFFLGIVGIWLSFLPKETLVYLQLYSSQFTGLFLQLMGALYFGFGMMNWMAKSSIIGGIYNRPIIMGNFIHFAVGAITLLKIVFNTQTNKGIVIVLAVIYTVFTIVFTIVFTYLFMKKPKQVKN